MSSPMADDRSALLAADLARRAGGSRLAVYAAVRATARVPDPLVGLGVPLLAYVLGSVEENPVRVTAVRGRHSAEGPLWGLGTQVEQWSLLIRCASELTITVDVASGPWTTGVGPLELRVEWMHRERVITFRPTGATVASAAPGAASLGLSGLEERLLGYAEEVVDLAADHALPEELSAAAAIVSAARRSAETGGPVDL